MKAYFPEKRACSWKVRNWNYLNCFQEVSCKVQTISLGRADTSLSYNLSLGLKTLAWNVMIHGGFIAWLFKCLVLVCFGLVECRQFSAIHPPCPWTLGPPGAHHIRVEGGAAPRPPQGHTKGGTTLKYYGKTQHIFIGIINRIWTNY